MYPGPLDEDMPMSGWLLVIAAVLIILAALFA